MLMDYDIVLAKCVQIIHWEYLKISSKCAIGGYISYAIMIYNN